MNQHLARRLAAVAVVSAVVTTSACSASDSGGTTGGSVQKVDASQLTTGAAKGDVDAVTWYGDYRPLYSLDPVKLADYPEETILPNLCEPMLHVAPDYSITTGAVAYEQPDATHVVLTLQDGVTFSDGSAVTAEDVAYSVDRNRDPEVASGYFYSFTNVASVEVTGTKEVTISFSTPDVATVQALATLAGAIVKKSFVESAKDSFGAPNVGVMCTGPFALASYDGTSKLVLKRNENYWDTSRAAKAATFTFVFPADPSAVGNGLTSGSIDGAFNVPISLLSTLKGSTAGKTYVGAEGSTPVNIDVLVTRSTGTLADTRVRQALSTALDRTAIAEKIFLGAADPLYRVSGPGLWGYAKDQFAADYATLPTKADPAAATALVDKAGAAGKSISFAYPAGDPQSQQLATVLKQTAESIGLTMKITALAAQQYGTLFADPAARASYDAILTKNYVELPEPLTMDSLYGFTGGGTNFSDYSNPDVDAAIAKARAEADPEKRATLVLEAERQLDQDLPSIPVVAPRAAVFLSNELAGAPLTFSYMTSAWAAQIGSK